MMIYLEKGDMVINILDSLSGKVKDPNGCRRPFRQYGILISQTFTELKHNFLKVLFILERYQFFIMENEGKPYFFVNIGSYILNMGNMFITIREGLSGKVQGSKCIQTASQTIVLYSPSSFQNMK